VNREAMEVRVDELRAAHPGRDEFVNAVRAFSETLDADEREVLGSVLLSRKPESGGGFEVLEQRVEEGGWFKRSLGRMAERERKIREGRPPR
jgi:hypothetical protein